MFSLLLAPASRLDPCQKYLVRLRLILLPSLSRRAVHHRHELEIAGLHLKRVETVKH